MLEHKLGGGNGPVEFDRDKALPTRHCPAVAQVAGAAVLECAPGDTLCLQDGRRRELQGRLKRAAYLASSAPEDALI